MPETLPGELVEKLTCARNLAEAVGQQLIRDVIDEALASLQPSVSEMRCKRCAELDRHTELAYAYYRATTCPCSAAERYVETCPKHGISPALSPEGEP